jgi:hypothetical protein
MPWTCCAGSLSDTVLTCPTCSKSKASWTLRFGGTRVFSLKNAGQVEITLVDTRGEPVPGERYRIDFPSSTHVEGVLDQEAYARAPSKRKGTCQVSFPDLDQSEWDWKVVQGDPAAGAAASAATALSFVELGAVAADGAPSGGLRYEVELPDGSTRAGTLGSDGRARLDGVPPGTCKITFPDLDASEWAPRSGA